MAREVVLIDTGLANLAAVEAAFRRLGASPRRSTAAQDVASASRLVLPGVGAFAPAMQRLRELGLAGPLARRLRQGAPTLAICLGMQLLCAGSREGDGEEAGLDLVPGQVERLPAAGLPWPQMGWNRVGDGAEDYAYFANGYGLAAMPAGWCGLMADYGSPFVAALRRGGVLGCQFHPELSGAFGARLLSAWLDQDDAAMDAAAGWAC
jgi:imidazole glycerol phosphate synthase glutamine amidotransferase subunit